MTPDSGGRVPVIALLGAECTGKTTLANALAPRVSALYVAEALREFCARHGRTPRPDEQASLLAEQMAREREAAASAVSGARACVLVDSTPLATALYSARLFGDESLLAQAVAHQRRYRLTLVTEPDFPWESDGIQRDGPGEREAFHELLLRTLQSHGLPHVRIGGDLAMRVQRAGRRVRHVIDLRPR